MGEIDMLSAEIDEMNTLVGDIGDCQCFVLIENQNEPRRPNVFLEQKLVAELLNNLKNS
jgi:hypothetical protein